LAGDRLCPNAPKILTVLTAAGISVRVERIAGRRQKSFAASNKSYRAASVTKPRTNYCAPLVIAEKRQRTAASRVGSILMNREERYNVRR